MFRGGLVVPSRMAFIMMLVYFVQFTLSKSMDINLNFLGIYPRKLEGLIGIFTAPLVHSTQNPGHIMSNIIPFLILAGTLYFFYDTIAHYVFGFCYFATNILVWLFAWNDGYHIGASGLVYGIASFLIFYGFFKRDVKSLIISVIILILYSGLVYGLLPFDPHVSVESHLFGAIVGLLLAMYFGKRNIPSKKIYIHKADDYEENI